MSPSDTIFALSSGHGRAGVAVVRVSGRHAAGALLALTGRRPFPERMARRVTVRDPKSNETLDQGLALWFAGPRSFTGEDVLELHLHGGPAVISGVLDALGRLPDTRAAEPGEFTRRAFLNGKLDLTEAEGLGDLIAAETALQRRVALLQSGGALRRLYDHWRGRVLEALALVEAGLDFIDEADVPHEVAARAAPILDDLRRGLRAHLADDRRGEIVRDGFRVVLAGAPNVGKSSLLNALARRPAAIVAEEPGTTRDAIEVWINIDGLAVGLCDTAGLRAATGAIEREGIRRALARAADADLVLWVVDATAPVALLPDALQPLAERVVPVLNKIDLIDARQRQTLPAGTLALSALTGEGVEPLMSRLGAIASERVRGLEQPVLTRRRYRDQLEVAAAAVDRFLAGDPAELELRAEDLRQAATAIGRITGRVDVEDVLDRIFAAFCIGK